MGNGMNKVLPGLFVGNFRDSKDQQQLTEHGISHILSIHDNARKLLCNNDKEYLCIIASDSPGQNLTQFFPVCNDFIHNARLKGGSVLIHCLAGMSRSVTVAVVYVMCVTSLNWRDSLKAVQGARNVANPNVGFMKQLQEFEKERLHDERRRLRDKYSDKCLVVEDEQMSKELLASYYHYISVGEMCEGNCHPGVVCPRGLCHTSRSMGIFRRNSGRENLSANLGYGTLQRAPSVLETPTSSIVSGSLHRTASSPASMSPECSPECSRNSSPSRSPSVGHRTITSHMLTPPASPSRYIGKLNVCNTTSLCSTEVTMESPTGNKRSPSSSYGQPTPPGSPSRSFRYYTEPNTPSPLSSPSASFNRVSSSKSLAESPSRKYCNGKVIHCPSHTPPASPMKSCRKRSANLSQLTPPESPLHFLRNKNKSLQEVGQVSKFVNTPMPPRLKESKGSVSTSSVTAASIKTTLKHNITFRKYKFCQRDVKSLDLSTHEENSSFTGNSPVIQLQSVPASPNKQSLESKPKGSPSRFCQVVIRLLPHLKSLNSSSKLCKHDRKQNSTKSQVSLYVDKEGRSTLISTPDNLSSSLNQAGKINDMQAQIGGYQGLHASEAETQVGIFKVCSNIQMLRKDSRPDLNLDLGTGKALFAEDGDIISSNTSVASNYSKTITSISSVANIPSTNIIVNPIFNLESKYITDSLCNEPFKSNDKKISTCTAFLKDDIIYIETTRNDLFSNEINEHSNINDVKKNLNNKKIPEDVNYKINLETKNGKTNSENKNDKTNLETKNGKTNSESKNGETNLETNNFKNNSEGRSKSGETNLKTNNVKTNSETETAKANLETKNVKTNLAIKNAKTNLETKNVKTDLAIKNVKTNLETKNVKSDLETTNAKAKSEAKNTKTTSETDNVKKNLKNKNVKSKLETKNVKTNSESKNVKTNSETNNEKNNSDTKNITINFKTKNAKTNSDTNNEKTNSEAKNIKTNFATKNFKTNSETNDEKNNSETRNINTNFETKNFKTYLETNNEKTNSETKNIKSNMETKNIQSSISEDKNTKLSSEEKNKNISDDKDIRIFSNDKFHQENTSESDEDWHRNYIPNLDSKNNSKTACFSYQSKQYGCDNKCALDLMPIHIKTDKLIHDKANEVSTITVFPLQNDNEINKSDVSGNLIGSLKKGFSPLSMEEVSVKKNEDSGISISQVVMNSDTGRGNEKKSQEIERMKIIRVEKFGMTTHVENEGNFQTHNRDYDKTENLSKSEHGSKENNELFNDTLAESSKTSVSSQDGKMLQQQNHKINEAISYLEDRKNDDWVEIRPKTRICMNPESETHFKRGVIACSLPKEIDCPKRSKLFEQLQNNRILQDDVPYEGPSLSPSHNEQKFKINVNPPQIAGKTTENKDGGCKSEHTKHMADPRSSVEKLNLDFQNDGNGQGKITPSLQSISKEGIRRKEITSHQRLKDHKVLQSLKEKAKDDNEITKQYFEVNAKQQNNLDSEKTEEYINLEPLIDHAKAGTSLVLSEDDKIRNFLIIDDASDEVIDIRKTTKESISLPTVSNQTNIVIRVTEHSKDLNDNRHHNENEANPNITNCEVGEKSELLLSVNTHTRPTCNKEEYERNGDSSITNNENEASELNCKRKYLINELNEKENTSASLFSDANERFDSGCKLNDDKSIKILDNSNLCQFVNIKNEYSKLEGFTFSTCKGVDQITKMPEITFRCCEGAAEVPSNASQIPVGQGFAGCSEHKIKEESNQNIAKEEKDSLGINPNMKSPNDDQSNIKNHTAPIKKPDQAYHLNEHSARPIVSSPPPIPPRRDKNPSTKVHATPPPIPPRKGSAPLLSH